MGAGSARREAGLRAARAKRFVFHKQENTPQEKGECERKMAETILRMTGIQKYFPGVHALDNAQLEVREGEVMALVGENGAGKSTLMKVLTGIYPSDGGTIEFFGKHAEIHGPRDAQALGICIVHQELNLMQHLTVAENIYIGREPMKGLFVDKAKQNAMTQELFDKLHLDLDPKAVVKTLSVAKQQMVEITKALSHENTRLLILDEPSAVLTDTEIDDLFVFIRQLKKTGVGIIYISHRLDEIFGLCSNVSVLRDGCHIDTIPVASVDRQGLINMMVGREMGQEYPKEVGNVGGTILEVKNLSRGILQDISFEVKSGEVFGISGLVGAGRTELARAILGIDKPESGEVYVRGKKVHYRTFADAIRDGLGLIPEDRKLQGLVQIMSVKRNTTLVNMKRVLRAGVISSSLEEKLSKEYADKLHVVTPSMETEVQYLSGGNQQKVVIAKWLFQNSEILFLDEPTRGIDVGAKAEIYRLINRMAKEGKTISMISSEMPELLGMCDRIMVMHEGHKMGELNAAEATQAKIMALCS